MKSTLTFLVVVLFFTTVKAQQLPLFSQYREYHSYINPATINSDFLRGEYNMSVGLSVRSQWSGQPNTPRTQFLRGEYILPDRDVGWVFGGHIINDQAGPIGFSGVYGRVGGIISGDVYRNGLVVGLSAGAVQHRIQASKIQLLEAGDALDGIDQTQIIPDIGLGIFYYTSLRNRDYIYGGVSIPQTLGLDLTYKTIEGDFDLNRVRHYYAVAGMYKFLGNSSYIEPSVWVRYVAGAPIGVDGNLRFQANDLLWVGAGFGTSSGISLEGGVFVGENIGMEQEFKVGYSFGRSVEQYGPVYGVTHEINIVWLYDNQ